MGEINFNYIFLSAYAYDIGATGLRQSPQKGCGSKYPLRVVLERTERMREKLASQLEFALSGKGVLGKHHSFTNDEGMIIHERTLYVSDTLCRCVNEVCGWDRGVQAVKRRLANGELGVEGRAQVIQVISLYLKGFDDQTKRYINTLRWYGTETPPPRPEYP